MKEMRKQCRDQCRMVGFDNEIAMHLTDGFVNIARAFLEIGEVHNANCAMSRVLSAAELEWDLIELQARLQDLKEEQEGEKDPQEDE